MAGPSRLPAPGLSRMSATARPGARRRWLDPRAWCSSRNAPAGAAARRSGRFQGDRRRPPRGGGRAAPSRLELLASAPHAPARNVAVNPYGRRQTRRHHQPSEKVSHPSGSPGAHLLGMRETVPGQRYALRQRHRQGSASRRALGRGLAEPRPRCGESAGRGPAIGSADA